MTKTEEAATKMFAGRRVPRIGPNQYIDRNGNVRSIALRHQVAKQKRQAGR